MVIADRSSDSRPSDNRDRPTDDQVVTDHPALTTVPREGRMEIIGRLRQASNQTFLATITATDGSAVQGVYKPIRGERPLWDFPEHTLGLREVAAYRVSRLGGFDVVPVTTLVDGAFGPGSMQVWVESVSDEVDQLVDLIPIDKVPQRGWFPIVEGYAADDSPIAVVHADDHRLRTMAVFDALVNNADRKGGHILANQGRVFGVDHGICFHTENKLRTLLWGWAGKPLLDSEREQITRVVEGAVDELADLLAEDEILALLERADDLLTSNRLPYPHSDWHTIPWPPF
jgi:uncharacterized repeat protein (TIGR03843 family)